MLSEMRKKPGGCPLGGPGSHQAHPSYRTSLGRCYTFGEKVLEPTILELSAIRSSL